LRAYPSVLVFTDDPAELLARLRTYVAPPPKWSQPTVLSA